MSQSSSETFETKHSWSAPLVVALLGAAVAAGANVIVAGLNGSSANSIEKSRSDTALVIEMIKGQPHERAAENLEFIVRAGLISSDKTKESLNTFLQSSPSSQIAFLPAFANLPSAPESLQECASESVVEVPDGEASRADAATLLARLRASELAKDRCARDWQSWHNTLTNPWTSFKISPQQFEQLSTRDN